MHGDVTAGATDAWDARAQLQIEEYKTLREEIARLDSRVERGISTMLTINAVIYGFVYLDLFFFVSKLLSAEQSLPSEIASRKPEALVILLFLNLVFAARYIATTFHIDKIGTYIARLESAIYHGERIALGWELLLREGYQDDDQREALVKNETSVDRFRRYVFWLALVIFNLYALADINCVLPVSIGESLCLA